MSKKEASSFCPANKAEWRQWLEENHDSEDAVWLIVYKKSSKTPNLNWGESVDEALCFGWIDSTKRSLDEERYTQYFTKRKPKSNWSKVNKKKVEELNAKGLMNEAGLKSVEVAKQNGSWTLLDSVEALIVPVDLENELMKYTKANDYFLSLSKSIRKGLLYWVVSAKRPETRYKRIADIAENASKNQIPKHFRVSN